MKNSLIILLCIATFSAFAQKRVNNYKFVLVPVKFTDFKQPNKYELNDLTKSMLEEKGFKVYVEDASLPIEIANQKCSALVVDLDDKSTMFTTNLVLQLKDCQGNIVFKSKDGKSREKDYKTAYTVALVEAFKSVERYEYQPNQELTPTTDTKQDVVNTAPATATPTSTSTATTALPTPAVQTVTAGSNNDGLVLYAQKVPVGYQLINTEPKVVFILFKTSITDCFIAQKGAVNGMVFKKGSDWYFEYYNNNQLNSEKLSIKF